jgi:kynurenine formamidase
MNFSWPVHRILHGNGSLIMENLGPSIGKAIGRRLDLLAAPIRIRDAGTTPVVSLVRIAD